MKDQEQEVEEDEVIEVSLQIPVPQMLHSLQICYGISLQHVGTNPTGNLCAKLIKIN